MARVAPFVSDEPAQVAVTVRETGSVRTAPPGIVQSMLEPDAAAQLAPADGLNEGVPKVTFASVMRMAWVMAPLALLSTVMFHFALVVVEVPAAFARVGSGAMVTVLEQELFASLDSVMTLFGSTAQVPAERGLVSAVVLVGVAGMATLKEPDLKERLASQGVEIVGSTPAAFGEFIRTEIPKWGNAVRLSGARID